MLKEDGCLVYREGKFQAVVFVYKKYRKIAEFAYPSRQIRYVNTWPVTGKMTVMDYIGNYGEFSKFQEMQ